MSRDETERLRATLARVGDALDSLRRLQAASAAEARSGAPLAREWADALQEAVRRVEAALGGPE